MAWRPSKILLPTMAATNERTRAAAPNNNDLHRHQQPHPPGVIAALSPPPFSARIEREELERLLPSSAPPPQLTTTASTTAVAMMPQNTMIAPPTTATPFVPTAVPIDDFTSGININDDDDVAVVAIATSVVDSTSPFHPASAAAAAALAFTAPSTPRTDLSGNNITTTSTTFTSIRSSPKTDYGKDIDADNNIVVLPEEALPTTATALTLPAISTSSSPLPRTNLRAANVMGTISSEYEIADVARAQRQVRHVLQEENELALQLANMKAAVAREGGEDEGLTVDGRIHNMYCDDNNNNLEASKRAQLKKDEEDEDVSPYGNAQRNGKRGYEVQPYDVSEYDPKGHEYEVSEYKSVYD